MSNADPAKGCHGFTLLELLVSITISAALIVLTVQIYQTVVRAGKGMEGGQRDWVAEQFVRGQFRAADMEINANFGLIQAERHVFSFATRKSAQYGNEDVPIIATYRYQRINGQLSYHEVTVPPWWNENYHQPFSSVSRLREKRGEGTWDAVVFGDVESAQFSYWNPEDENWTTTWHDHENLPPLVKLEFARFNNRTELVLETTALSFSSRYGS